jgi:hypothetical protein
MEIYKQLLKDDPKQLIFLLEESAELYLDYLSKLFEAIDRPVIKLWLSRRALDATSIELAKDSPAKLNQLAGIFPMFSDSTLFNRSVQILKKCSDLSTGINASFPSISHHAINLFTGAPENWWIGLKQGYYPSAHMHLNAYELIYAYLVESGIVN